MPPLIRRCLLLLLFSPSMLHAATLNYEVTGLDGEPQRNVLAHLGPAPETTQQRLNFVVSARQKVRNGLKALGYYQPHIDLDVQRTDPVWQMRIAVELGEPVRIRDISIQILGTAANDPEFVRLTNNLGFATGDVLHHGRFVNFRKELSSLGQQRGYLDGEISQSQVQVRVNAGTADVIVRYESGPRFRFGDIMRDLALLDDKLFDALVPFHPGDYYEQAKLREFQWRLQQTNYFSSVIVQPLLSQARGNTVPIAVDLLAAKRHSFEVGVGYSTDTEERVSLTWRTPKINRFGHSQVTRVELSPVNPNGRFTYSIPITNPLNDIVHLWTRLEDDEYGDIDSRQGELGARREMRQGKWIYGYSLRGLNESWDVWDTSNDNNYLLLGGSVSSREHTGSLVDPKGGFNQLYSVEAASHELGSDVDLVRLAAELRYIATPWPRHRFLTRAEMGAVEISSDQRDDLSPSLGFFAGGNQSIRGYAYQSLGHEEFVTEADGSSKRLVVAGNRLLIGSVEYQYYFTDKWRGALFVDSGDAFDDGAFEAKVGAGFGIHYITPVGAIRVELANSVSEQNPDWYLHLTVGAEF
jgi:translocation and assembly module TamA